MSGDVELGLPALVTSAEWAEEDQWLLRIRSCVTRVEDGAQVDWRQPRWRVHAGVKNFKELFKRLDSVVKMADQGVENALVSVTFPDAKKTSILQCGMSDWDFAHMAVRQYNRLCKDDAMKPLIISGSVDDPTAGKWILTWGAQKPYKDLGEVDAHKMQFGQDDGFERVDFGAVSRLDPNIKHPVNGYASTGQLRQGRPFDEQKWKQWRSISAPMFTAEGDMAWHVRDRVFERHAGETPGWSTSYALLPPDGTIYSPANKKTQRPCVVLGKVEESDGFGPWFDVRLDGFEAEDDQNLAHVRLTTPYSGKDEKSGMHFMCEADTRLAVAWSGQFEESVMFLNNTRWDKESLESPSLWLAKMLLMHLSKVNVKTDVHLKVEKQTKFDTVKTMALTADGVKVHWVSSRVKTMPS